MAALSQGSWHEYRIEVPFCLEKIVSDYPESVIYTQGYEDLNDPESESGMCFALLKIDDTCWISGTKYQVQVFARTRELARDLAEGVMFIYRKRDTPKPAEYHLIKKTAYGIAVENIPLTIRGRISERHLTLFYGDDFSDWHLELVQAFHSCPTGITLLEGAPGTGKTSYIRHLMCELKDTHRFYFIPSSNLDVLKDSGFVDFWSQQRHWYPNRQLVVILEDSEEALVPRSSDNQADVGILLNITDGLLGEFLRLQVICTVNCPVDQLDPALLRPGRLIARRNFARLRRERAQEVAEALGKNIPEEGDDFSLAEIFNGQHKPVSEPRRQIGFAT